MMTSVEIQRLKRVKIGCEWANIFRPHQKYEAEINFDEKGLEVYFNESDDVLTGDRVAVEDKLYGVDVIAKASDGRKLAFCSYDQNETALEELTRMGKCEYGVIQSVHADTQTERFMDAWVGTYVLNIAEHYHKIKSGRDIKPLFGLAQHDVPAVCVGAGPSLDRNVELLKDFPGIIIAVDKSYKMLVARGIDPDLVVSVDCHPKLIADMLDAPMNGKHSLVLNTCSDPDILKVWQGKVYWYLMKHPGVQFTDRVLPALFPTFSSLANVGCVGNSAVLTADHCGFSPVYLIGYDFGYTGGKMHAQRFGFDADGKPFEIEDDHADLLAKRTGKLESNGVETYVPYLGYARALHAIRVKLGVDVVNCTGGGILTELPVADFETVIREQSQGSDGRFRDIREKMKSL